MIFLCFYFFFSIILVLAMGLFGNRSQPMSFVKCYFLRKGFQCVNFSITKRWQDFKTLICIFFLLETYELSLKSRSPGNTGSIYWFTQIEAEDNHAWSMHSPNVNICLSGEDLQTYIQNIYLLCIAIKHLQENSS